MSFASTILSPRSLFVCASFLAHIALGFGGAAHAAIATVGGHDVYYEVHGDLSSGETPILLLHGGMTAVAMADTIPNAWLAILPDTTHMTIMSRTDLLGAMIESWIASDEKEHRR